MFRDLKPCMYFFEINYVFNEFFFLASSTTKMRALMCLSYPLLSLANDQMLRKNCVMRVNCKNWRNVLTTLKNALTRTCCFILLLWNRLVALLPKPSLYSNLSRLVSLIIVTSLSPKPSSPCFPACPSPLNMLLENPLWFVCPTLIWINWILFWMRLRL